MPFGKMATGCSFYFCRTGRRLVFSESVPVAFEADDIGVMDDAADHGSAYGQASEAVALPTDEREVGRQNYGRVFLTAGDQLKEQLRGILSERI